MGKKQRQAALNALESLPDHAEKALLATGRYLGEGFDDERLDTLFLTLPISWRGTLSQYAGRLHRIYDRKKEVVIYDYVDVDVPVLVRMYERRTKGYRSIGYKIEDDQS
jgi:superfamily II DNA or RNA helicase